MTLLEDWLERSDWSRRSVELGELREVRDSDGEAVVAMELAAPVASGVVFERLWQLWLGLPNHRNVLLPVRANDGGRPLLRYALGWIDVQGEVRIAFLPAKGNPGLTARLPPEAIDQWPRCDERGAIYVVGRLLRDWVLDDESQSLPVCQIIRRCIAENPADRFTSLTQLLDAFVAAGGRRKAPHDWRSTWKAWTYVETGLGYLAMGRPGNAGSWFEQAVKHDKISRTTRRAKQSPTAETLVLRGLRDEASKLADGADRPAPLDAEPRTPDEGPAQLARGKRLWVLGRVREAREAFERASATGPQLLTAMHLRRELDRALASVRAAAGIADASRFDLPDHLAELRDVLIDGHTTDAIQVLSGPDHQADAVAQLLLAGLLMYKRRHAEALEIYDRILALDDEHLHAAELGKADALLQLGRPDEASKGSDPVH